MKKKSKLNDVVLRANDMKFSNGARYSGAIKDVFDSRPHGHGIYFYPDHLDEGVGDHLYRGNFKNAKFHGHGEYVSKQYNYKGEFKNQKFHGKGEYSKEGYNYKGDFKNDKPNGKGVEIILEKDNIYTGTFKNGRRHGYGISRPYKNKNIKNIYKGQWVDGSMTKGTFEFDFYENFGQSVLAAPENDSRCPCRCCSTLHLHCTRVDSGVQDGVQA